MVSRKFERYQLDNGLTVLLNPLASQKKATLACGIGVGSANETPDIYGAAHLNEHMLFTSNQHRDKYQLNEDMEFSGIHNNASTSKTGTNIFMSSLPKDIGKSIEITSQMIKNEKYNSDELINEKNSVLADMSDVYDNPSIFLATKVFIPKVYEGTVFEHPTAGYEDSVMNLTEEQLIDFKKKFYVPSNMIVSVAGKFDPEVAKKCIDINFRDMKYREKPERIGRVTPAINEGDFTVKRSNTKQAFLIMGYNVPGTVNEDCSKLTFLASVIGEGFTGKMTKKLRVENGIGYNIGGYYNPFTSNNGMMFLNILGFNSKRVGDARKILREVVDESKSELLTERVLEGKRTQILSNFLENVSTPMYIASEMISRELYPEIIMARKHQNRLSKITSEDVRDTARKYLQGDGITAILMPG